MAVYRTALCFQASVHILGVWAKKAECAEQPLWHKHVQGLVQHQAHSALHTAAPGYMGRHTECLPGQVVGNLCVEASNAMSKSILYYVNM